MQNSAPAIMGPGAELEVKIENEAFLCLQNKNKKALETQEKAICRATGELKQLKALLTKKSETCEHTSALGKALKFPFYCST